MKSMTCTTFLVNINTTSIGFKVNSQSGNIRGGQELHFHPFPGKNLSPRRSGTFLTIRHLSVCTVRKRMVCEMCAKPVKSQRKPRGYWSVRENVVKAVQDFARNSPSPDKMPTAAELIAAGRYDLLRAVQRNDGFATVATYAKLLPCRRRRGFWWDFGSRGGLAYIETELRTLQEAKEIAPGMLPSAHVLRDLERDDLVSAILCSGGFSEVANVLGLSSPAQGRPRSSKALQNLDVRVDKSSSPMERRLTLRRRKPSYYWTSWRCLEIQLRKFSLKYCDGHMPLQRELRENGRSDLANAIRLHGGFAHVARRAGLTPTLSVMYKRPKGYWSDSAVLHGELLTFMTKYGYPGVMPRRDQLLKAGRSDMVYALQKHGGYSVVAAELHLMWHGPSNFWRVFRNLQRRVGAFLKKHGEKTMPSMELLHEHGRMDLIHGIALHGGVMVVARRIGLEVKFPERADGYWKQPKNIQSELEALILKRPLETQRYMPSSVALVQAGRADLAKAIRDYGGWVYYGQRLGLRFAFEVRGQGFWQRETNVFKELLSYVENRYGTWEFPGKPPPSESTHCRRRRKPVYIPCLEMLKRDGRSDIAFALGRYHGGIEAFAKKYDLKIASDVISTLPTEYLTKWSVFSSEVEDWTLRQGTPGIIPTRQDLKETGRNDLRFAMYRHGGADCVAKRLQHVNAEKTLDVWLPQWLGLQAGRLGALMQIARKAETSKMEQQLMNKLNQHLDAKGPSKHRVVQGRKGNLSSCGSLLGKRYRRGRKRVAQMRKVSGKLTKSELQTLRERYKHLSSDDIIKI